MRANTLHSLLFNSHPPLPPNPPLCCPCPSASMGGPSAPCPASWRPAVSSSSLWARHIHFSFWLLDCRRHSLQSSNYHLYGTKTSKSEVDLYISAQGPIHNDLSCTNENSSWVWFQSLRFGCLLFFLASNSWLLAGWFAFLLGYKGVEVQWFSVA